MKKILVLGLVAIVAMSALGVGYALWAKTLVVTGTVNTGNIGAIWSADGAFDDEAPDKDVSGIQCWVGSTQVGVDDLLEIVITNAYPSIWYTCIFNVESVGTVPIHLGQMVLEGDPCLDVVLDAPVIGTQLHEGDVVYGSIGIHLTNACEMNTEYYLSGMLEYGQYNEYP
jgi:hypothetical protein